MGGGSSKPRKRVTFADDYDNEEDDHDNRRGSPSSQNKPSWPTLGAKERSQDSNMSLGQMIINRSRGLPNDGSSRSPSPTDRYRSPSPTLVKVGNVSYLKENKNNEDDKKTTNAKKKERPHKPTMSMDLWDSPSTEKTMIINSETEPQTRLPLVPDSQRRPFKGSYKTRKEYDKTLTRKRLRQQANPQNNGLYNNSDPQLYTVGQKRKSVEVPVASSSTRPSTKWRMLPDITPGSRGGTSDVTPSRASDVTLPPIDENDTVTSRISTPRSRQVVGDNDNSSSASSGSKKSFTAWRQQRIKDVGPRGPDDEPVNAYHLLSHGFSGTSPHFVNNVSLVALPIDQQRNAHNQHDTSSLY